MVTRGVGESRTVEVALQVAGLSEAVTVRAEPTVLDLTGGEDCVNVSPEEVRELPVNGRNFARQETGLRFSEATPSDEARRRILAVNQSDPAPGRAPTARARSRRSWAGFPQGGHSDVQRPAQPETTNTTQATQDEETFSLGASTTGCPTRRPWYGAISLQQRRPGHAGSRG